MIGRCGLALLASVAIGCAGGLEEDWAAITALDRGPQTPPRSAGEARAVAGTHLDRQEKALRGFIAEHATDARAFEARLRLVRLLEIRGGFQGSEKARVEASQLLNTLEKSATPEQRVEVDFACVTRLMRGAQKSPAGMREPLLAAARRFQAEHPGDRRVAALLAEVATLFDSQPKVKAALLKDAKALTTDPGLQGRIADDFKRIDLLGHEPPLAFTSTEGREVKLADFRGHPVLVVFFADFSPPSTEALAGVQRVIAELPKNAVSTIGVSLDPRRESLDSVMKSTSLSWPVAFDGKSWEGELVRSLGINALPTVWLLDKEGKLRALNALEGTADLIRQLLRE